jgi:hypothetical protein
MEKLAIFQIYARSTPTLKTMVILGPVELFVGTLCNAHDSQNKNNPDSGVTVIACGV